MEGTLRRRQIANAYLVWVSRLALVYQNGPWTRPQYLSICTRQGPLRCSCGNQLNNLQVFVPGDVNGHDEWLGGIVGMITAGPMQRVMNQQVVPTNQRE